MKNLIAQEVTAGIAVLRLNNPPFHALTDAMRHALGRALQAAADDPAVLGIVLTGMAAGPKAARSAGLSAGLRLVDLAPRLAQPDTQDLCLQIEQSAKPVVAVLHGMTLGAGAELALAAHARVAVQGALLGFPGVMLGVSPQGGATQRLPRLVGAQAALDLLLGQHPRTLTAPAYATLVDAFAPDDAAALAAALTLAQELAAALAAGQPLRRSGALWDGLADYAANAAAIAETRQQVADNPNTAAARIVDCVEAAGLLPLEAGLAFEATVFADLVASDVSQALRHVSLAEHRAHQIPELARATARPVTQVALVGGGQLAAQLAVACLAAGLRVVHFERNDDALQQLRDRITAALGSLHQARQRWAGPDAQGQPPQPDGAPDLDRWQGTTQLSDLTQAGLLIEAVADNLATKAQVLTALDRLAAPDAVLVTTSSLHKVADIAAATARPAAVLGLRLPFPVHLSRFAEVLPADGITDQAVADGAMATLCGVLRDRMGRFVIRSGTGGGGLGEPVVAALQAAACGMLRLGGTVARIDSAMQGYGFAHGVFRQMDLIGLDLCLERAKLAALQVDCGPQLLADLDRLVLAGRTGQKAGRGFYLWRDGRAQPDPAVAGLLDLPAAPQGGHAPPEPEAIILRALAAMANAGARLLRAGCALRPSDIDLAMVLAHGYPRWHGGPMQAADMVGLFEISRALGRFAGDDAALYTAEQSFAALVREGQHFASLNHAGAKPCVLPGG